MERCSRRILLTHEPPKELSSSVCAVKHPTGNNNQKPFFLVENWVSFLVFFVWYQTPSMEVTQEQGAKAVAGVAEPPLEVVYMDSFVQDILCIEF